MKRNAILWTVGIVAALVAYGWIEGVFRERNELRATLMEAESEYRDAAAQVDRLEARLSSARAALPKAGDRSYQRGWSDGIARACDSVYGTGPTLEGVVLRDGSIGDTWSRSFGEFAIIRAIVVIVSLEDGSSHRATREECRSLRGALS